MDPESCQRASGEQLPGPFKLSWGLPEAAPGARLLSAGQIRLSDVPSCVRGLIVHAVSHDEATCQRELQKSHLGFKGSV